MEIIQGKRKIQGYFKPEAFTYCFIKSISLAVCVQTSGGRQAGNPANGSEQIENGF